MQRRHTLPLFLPFCCLLWLLAGCTSGQGPATPTPTLSGPPFEETTPLVMHPPLFTVNNLLWSPDGKRVAIASADGVIQVWEAATGRLISTHYDSGRSTKVSLLGWTADGKRLIATILGPANTVQVWDAETGSTLLTFSHSYPVAASHDGKYVAVGNGGSVQIWETATGTQVATFDTATAHVDSVAWSPDDSLLATTNTQQLAGGASQSHLAQVWNAVTATQVCAYHNTSTSYIDHLAWSPDNRRIVSISGTGSGSDAIVAQVWNATSCQPIFRLHGNLLQAADLSWSPDGTHIVSWESTAAPLQVWDAAAGNLSFTIGDMARFIIFSQAWSPDGKQIAVVGEPLKMQLFDVSTGQPQISYHLTTNQSSVAWSPDGQYLASVDALGTTIWEANADRRVAFIPARYQVERTVTWSPDGKQIAAEDGASMNVGIWDPATNTDILGDLEIYHEAQFDLFNYRNATAVAWSPDGAHIAAAWSPNFTFGAPAQQVYIWGNTPTMCGLDSDCPVSGGSHAALITALAWSPDGTRIASASMDKTVLIYDVAHQKNLLIYRGHTDTVTAVSWSSDGKYIASAGVDKTIQVWDAASGKQVLTLRGHTDTVTAVAWSPDSKRIVSSSEDGTVRVWDAIHGATLLTYRGHRGAVLTVAWSPKGRYIASAGADETVQVWDANTGKPDLVYRGHSDAVLAVVWSPDGRRIASAGADGTIQLW